MKYHLREEEVNGVIIGGDTWPYEFWTRGAEILLGNGHKPQCFLGKGHFASDTEAESYAKNHWPDEYAKGIEMRVYDRVGAAA